MQYEAEIRELKRQLDDAKHEADYRQSGLQVVIKQKQEQLEKLSAQQATLTVSQELERKLASGSVFLKHGRSGRPHQRYVRVINDRMEWNDVKSTAEGYIRLSDVTDVVEGIATAVARRTGDRMFACV